MKTMVPGDGPEDAHNAASKMLDEKYDARHVEIRPGSHIPIQREEMVSFAKEFSGEDTVVGVYPAYGPETVIFAADQEPLEGDNIMNFWLEMEDEYWYFGYHAADFIWSWECSGPIEKKTDDSRTVEETLDAQNYEKEIIKE